MRKIKFYLIGLTFLLLNNTYSKAQGIDPKQEAVFVYNLLRYIDWPRDDGHSDFIIEVLGKGDIVKEIQLMAAQKTVGDRKIIVKVYDDTAKLEHCHLLFITKSHSCCLQKARQKLKDMSALYVTEDKGMISKGADINFIVRDNKIMFELNEKSLNAHNLKMSNELKKFAVKVED